MVDKQWARWQDCHDYENLKKGDMDKTHYESNSWDKKDSIDVPMPYFLKEDPFVPGAGCTKESVEAEPPTGKEHADKNACAACISTNMEYLGKTCVSVWHDLCPSNVCGSKVCAATCGTGGNEHRDLMKSDFVPKTLKNYGYEWDHDKFGATARDWLLGTKKYGFQYMVDDFDHEVSGTACNMAFPKEGKSAIVATPKQTQSPEQKAMFLDIESGGFSLKDLVNKAGLLTKPKLRWVSLVKALKKKHAEECKHVLNSNMCKSLDNTKGGCVYACGDCAAKGTCNSHCLFQLLFGIGGHKPGQGVQAVKSECRRNMA